MESAGKFLLNILLSNGGYSERYRSISKNGSGIKEARHNLKDKC